MAAPTLAELQRKALLDCKTIELAGYTYPVARTPVGPGLAAYMSFIHRRKKRIWDWAATNGVKQLAPHELAEMSPEEVAEYKEKLDVYETNLAGIMVDIEVDDTNDLVTALYFSVARVDPSVDIEVLRYSIDAYNKEDVANILMELNTVKPITKDSDPNVVPAKMPETNSIHNPTETV